MREQDVEDLYENESYEFMKNWEKVAKLNTLVDTLGKSEDFEESFNYHYRDFIEFMQTEYKEISPEIRDLIPSMNEDSGYRLAFAREQIGQANNSALKYSLKYLDDLLDQSKDRLPILTLATGIMPIKDIDLDKTDNLDDLINEYEDTIDILTRNLANINREQEKERYESQEQTIKEYKESIDLIEDYRGLVEISLAYRQLASYLGGGNGGNEREPDTNKIREIFFNYLDGLLEIFEGDDEKYIENEAIVNTIKTFSRDQNMLNRYYQTKILAPAQRKYETEIEKYDIEDYIKRNIDITNPNKQINFFMGLYGTLKAKETEEREKRTNQRLERLFKL